MSTRVNREVEKKIKEVSCQGAKGPDSGRTIPRDAEVAKYRAKTEAKEKIVNKKPHGHKGRYPCRDEDPYTCPMTLGTGASGEEERITDRRTCGGESDASGGVCYPEAQSF